MTQGESTARGMARQLVCAAVVLGAAAAAHAQALPSGPISIGGGRMTIGGDVSAGFGSADPGFFNLTDYEHSALRLLQVDLSAALNAGDHVALLGEIRTQDIDSLTPYAFYVRIRPWTGRNLDIQIGRIPPTFGAFARRTYPADNPLIGYPLAYQYMTSLRPDSLPASADELLQRSGVGWRDRFSIGDQTKAHGVPLVSAFQWDTGLQVHAASHDQIVSATVAVTTGPLSDPMFIDGNSGRQWTGRLELRPLPGLIVGGSLARGPFVTAPAARAAVGEGHDSAFTQSAWGADVEYSRDHYLVRLESVVSDWRLPIVLQPALELPLRAASTSVEARYRIVPGLYAAGRVDHLGFSDVIGTSGSAPWDAPVTRVEAGGGFSIQRNLLLKMTYQHNTRTGGPLVRTERQTAAQLVFWF